MPDGASVVADSTRPGPMALLARARHALARQKDLVQTVDRLQVGQAKLRARVERLESEITQERHLQRRLAELTDVVQHLVIPAAQRDDDKLRELLEQYSDEF